MQGRSAQGPGEALADQIAAAPDLTHVVAILWTWLESHMRVFGSLEASAYTIKEAASHLPFVEVDDDALDHLRSEPVIGAATLLARIARHLSERLDSAIARRATGWKGVPVVVVWKDPKLSDLTGEERSPGSMEHPSLETLAPRFAVCPLEVDEIILEVVPREGPGWDAAMLRLKAAVRELPDFSVHLDPLQHHGMTGWTERPDGSAGWFDESEIDPDDEERCRTAAVDAVTTASGSPSILILPELAATTKVRASLQEALHSGHKTPALTVAGLYHQPADADALPPSPLLGSASIAGHVNEALVLGPRGHVLWRHRKLSKAEGLKGRNGSPVVEDIILGNTLQIAVTPIGIVTTVICLDSFQGMARNRLVRSGADVILVPSLSPRVERHRTSLGHVVQGLWGAAFVCNRALPSGKRTTTLWNGKATRSFWVFQRREVTVPPPWVHGTHPSFVFRMTPAT